MANDDDLSRLRTLAKDDAVAADSQLQQELAALRRMTRSQLDALKPRLSTDEATFNQLVQAVEQATAENMSLAELTNRLKTLGTNVLAVARHASTLMPI